MGRSDCLKISRKPISLFLFQLNRYGVTSGPDIDQAEENGGEAQGPKHKGVVADLKIIKEI